MKKIIAGALIVASLLPNFSQALEISRVYADLENLSFVNDQGTGRANDVYIEIGESSNSKRASRRNPIPQDIYVYRMKEDLQIETGFATVTWRKMPLWLTIDLDLVANDVKAKLGYAPGHQITASSIILSKPSLGRATVRDLKVVCTPTQGESAKFEKLLAQCLNKGTITATELDIPTLKEFWSEVLEDRADNTDNLQKVAGDLTFNLNKGKFDLALKTKIFLKARIKAAGDIQLDEKTNIARLKIDEVRFGKMNITKLVLPVLSAILPDTGFKIQKPYIYVQL